MNKKVFIAVGIFIVASLIGWLAAKYYIFPEEKKDSHLIELNDKSIVRQESNQDMLNIKVYFPSNDEMANEEIIVQKRSLPLEILETALDEYIKRLEWNHKNSKVLGVYRDRNNIIYLDFSEELKNEFHGDIKKEHLFLKSLYKTVISNIADIEDIRILINGKEVDTIGGHIFILYGLKEAIRIDE
jgi:hypothetical protein